MDVRLADGIWREEEEYKAEMMNLRSLTRQHGVVQSEREAT